MLAYTGAVTDRWWGKLAIDLGGIEVPERLPMLLNHDAEQVVGVSDGSKLTEKGLVLEGSVSGKTDAGKLVSDLTDESQFPWTASIGVEPLVVEEVQPGAEAEVNGQKVIGPAEIWRKSRLGETSFVTAWPADKNTSAQLLRAEERSRMKPEEFLKANPQVVEAWKQEAAKSERESLLAKIAEFRKAFPERLAFAIDQLTAGKSLVEARAEESELLRAEVAELKARAAAPAPAVPAPAATTAAAATIESLEGKTRRTTLGFDGASRQGGADELAGLAPDERAKREWERDPDIRAAFTSEKAYAAYLRFEAKGLVRQSVINRASEALLERSGQQ